jgi:hypothetical protein
LSRKAILVEAALALATARVAIMIFPFRRIAPGLAKATPQQMTARDPELAQHVRLTAWAIQAAERRLPWKSSCLVQAIAGKWMLRRRHVPSALYLGVDKGAEKSLEAHAWLRAGGVILTGGPGHQRFSVIATFEEPRA